MAGTFNDDNGSTSIMRIIFAFYVLIVIVTWAIISIRQNMLISFGAWDAVMISIPFIAKVGQKAFEVWGQKKSPAPESKPIQ